MIPLLRREMVDVRGWFSDDEITDIISVCQSLPGVIAVNMATYVGFKRRGLLGSLVATVGVILPSFVVILFLSQGIARMSDNPALAGALGGLRAATAGLIAIAVYQVIKYENKNIYYVAGVVVSFVAIVFFKLSIVLVVPAFMLAGIARAFILSMRKCDKK